MANQEVIRFPEPASLDADERRCLEHDPQYGRLIHAMINSEDESERARMELAFAIYLLDSNYRLGPRELNDMLAFPTGGPAQSEFRRAFHGLAEQHIDWYWNTVVRPIQGNVRKDGVKHAASKNGLGWIRATDGRGSLVSRLFAGTK